MKWKFLKDMETELGQTCYIIKIKIPDEEFMKLEVSEYDQLLYAECEKSGKLPDLLLALEHLTRKIEEWKDE